MKIHVWYNNQFGLMVTWGTQFEGRKYISFDLPFLIIQVLGKRPKKLNGRIFSEEEEKICDECGAKMRTIYACTNKGCLGYVPY
jgi:hypothetical protein